MRDDWYALCVASGLGKPESAKRANGETYPRYVGLKAHDFRRSAICNLDRIGIPQAMQMKISGRRTSAAWRTYRIGNDKESQLSLPRLKPRDSNRKTTTYPYED